MDAVGIVLIALIVLVILFCIFIFNGLSLVYEDEKNKEYTEFVIVKVYNIGCVAIYYAILGKCNDEWVRISDSSGNEEFENMEAAKAVAEKCKGFSEEKLSTEVTKV